MRQNGAEDQHLSRTLMGQAFGDPRTVDGTGYATRSRPSIALRTTSGDAVRVVTCGICSALVADAHPLARLRHVEFHKQILRATMGTPTTDQEADPA